jgi:hypothetical protein
MPGSLEPWSKPCPCCSDEKTVRAASACMSERMYNRPDQSPTSVDDRDVVSVSSFSWHHPSPQMPSQAVRVMAIEQHTTMRHLDSKTKPCISRLILNLMFQGCLRISTMVSYPCFSEIFYPQSSCHSSSPSTYGRLVRIDVPSSFLADAIELHNTAHHTLRCTTSTFTITADRFNTH